MKLDGKTAIITGGGSGIGRATAFALAQEGANLVVGDIDFDAASYVADEIEDRGHRAQALSVDVSNRLDVNRMVQQTLTFFSHIDILVNNAGVLMIAPPEEESEEQWDTTLNVNLKGQFLCSQAVGRQMIQQGGGRIVHIASNYAHMGVYNMAAYCASKGGVLSLVKALAINWAKYHITVNAISPGITVTAMTQRTRKNPEEFVRWMEQAIPLHRANKPEDIANAVLFLVSPESGTITGQEIIIDGGTCVMNPSHVLSQ